MRQVRHVRVQHDDWYSTAERIQLCQKLNACWFGRKEGNKITYAKRPLVLPIPHADRLFSATDTRGLQYDI